MSADDALMFLRNLLLEGRLPTLHNKLGRRFLPVCTSTLAWDASSGLVVQLLLLTLCSCETAVAAAIQLVAIIHMHMVSLFSFSVFNSN